MIGRIKLWSVPGLFSTLNLCISSHCCLQQTTRFASLPATTTKSRLLMERSSDVHLRINDESDRFQLAFLYHVPDVRLNKQLQFTRNLSESVGTFLNRLSMKVNTAVHKKQKKNKKPAETVDEATSNVSSESLTVNLIKNGAVVSESVLCKEVFTCDDDSKVALQIGDQLYTILINYPWIQTINLPKCIMAGYPVFPSKFVSYYTDEAESQFDWHRQLQKGYELVSSGIVYVPSVSDIGHKLKLICTPKRNGVAGIPMEIISSSEVDAGPGFCPFETRHAFTRAALTNDSFRVVTYNILADLYASSETGKNELFSYVPPYALSMDYRKQLIMKELIGYNADIISLQEVDCRIFDVDLHRCLKTNGYDGEFAKKGGQVSEGVATFFKKSRFKLVSCDKLTLGEDSHELSYLSHIWDAVSKDESLYAKLKERTTAAQILLLDYLDKPNHKLIVANTHLYFHPSADHIRLLQAAICLGFINNLLNRLNSEDPNSKISVVFCGDFNSTPECGVYKLFTTNFVPETYHEWKYENCSENDLKLSLHNPISFESACGTPEFTNYTRLFAGCLDYIFYQKDLLTVEQVIPFPAKEDVMKHVGIPSVVFPSDHIALVADLAWK
ncbi:2',5'-phosphodiesterase 12 [Planococcus citri]|uniref:2',5'-phosphodiesterase 12 n=1 Tax=Planococcus citri TaxID=170843 RepID=UPI0031F76088